MLDATSVALFIFLVESFSVWLLLVHALGLCYEMCALFVSNVVLFRLQINKDLAGTRGKKEKKTREILGKRRETKQQQLE